MKSEDAKAIFLLEYCAEECDGYQKDDTCENCEINLAIKAIDKQIPKKPVSKYKYRDGENVCPSCETENRCRIVMFWEKFCPDCGQAIGWEAEKWQRD